MTKDAPVRPSAKDKANQSAPRRVVDTAFLEQLRGFSLTTAEILYRLPDYPAVLQSFVWQDYDLSPRYPKLRGFLDFWTRNLDGPLYCIRVAHAGLIRPAELTFVDGEIRLH